MKINCDLAKKCESEWMRRNVKCMKNVKYKGKCLKISIKQKIKEFQTDLNF